MNREIKFRVRNAITKQIVGYERINKDGHWEQQRVGRTEWLLGVITDNNLAEGLNCEQLTGLQDKNGKEIYEGDVVSCWDNAAKDPLWGLDKIHTGIIKFAPPAFVLSIPGKLIYDGGAVKQWENDVILTHWCNAENIEVIGNIYENPNLLTQ